MQSTSVIVLVLTVVLVTAAVYVGTQVFKSNSVDASRDAIASELKDLAAASLKHYNRPAFMGGGDHSFKNLDKMQRKNTKSKSNNGNGNGKGNSKNDKGTDIWETDVATYYLVIAEKDSAVIQGIGEEIGRDGVNPVAVQLVVKKNFRKLSILN